MNPITLRQSFQGANFEAIREAQGFNDLLAREAAQKRVLDERNAEEQANVPGIPRSEALRTEERKGRGGQPGQQENDHAGEGSTAEEEAPEPPAITADGHLDLLA